MTTKEIAKIFQQNSDPAVAAKMSAYMRDQFPYLGLPTPLRRRLSRLLLKTLAQQSAIDWQFITDCWQQAAREFQYLALDYLNQNRAKLGIDDIPKLQTYIVTKTWWDSVDSFDLIIGDIALRDPQAQAILLDWSVADNFWLRRLAIDHQLLRKEKTDTALLEKIIVNNLQQDEFFINKAIGWSLRDYSKTDPDWVSDFLNKYQDRMAALSIKEAGKHLKKPTRK